MNLKRSIKVSLAQKDRNQQWLAEKSGIAASHISTICTTGNASLPTIKALSDALDMSVSAFIAIGEDSEQ